MPILRVKTGEHGGSVFELGDAPLVVGRDERAEIQLLDQGVSRRHAEFYRIGEMFFIRDLDSRNGTFVNEERIKEELLRDTDEVRIASTVLLFEDKGSQAIGPAAPRKRSRVRTAPGAEATTTIQIDEHLTRDLDDLAEPTHHEQSHDLNSLYDCSRLISEARDPTQLCDGIVRLAGESAGAEHACIFLKKEGSREYELEASWQPENVPGLKGAPVISTRVIVEVVQTKRAVLSSDVKKGPSPDPKASLLGIGRPATVIGAPLVALDRVHGVLYCASHDPHRFGGEALELITAMAIQAGIALQSLLLNQRQERVLVSAVRTLSSLLEMRDPVYTGHSARVAFYCAAIARALRISRAETRRIQLAALLHNVAKIAMPPGLPDDEYNPSVIRKWNEISEKLVRRIEGLDFVLPVIQTYHERMDGAGLPEGLVGDRIPLAARILAVADRYDTLRVRGDAPEFRRHSRKETIEVIRGDVPDRYDSRVLDALLDADRSGWLRLPDRSGSGERERPSSGSASGSARRSAQDGPATGSL